MNLTYHRSPLNRYTRLALASVLLFTSATSLASSLPEKDFLTQSLGKGVYELSIDNAQNALFVASAPSFDKDAPGGIVYKLNPENLNISEKITTSRRAFGTALDEANHILYTSNTLDGSVTLIDTRSGKELAVVQLSEAEPPKKTDRTRELVLDKPHHRLYVSGVVENGMVWVVDTQTRQKIATIENMGKFPTGLAVDPENNRLYVVNGNNELIIVDTKTNEIVNRFSIEPEEKHFFLNIALDAKNNRAFITDRRMDDVLVVDINTGKVIAPIKTSSSLAVLYNEQRQEVYISHRNAQRVSIVDSDSLQIKQTIDTTGLPNSLLLSADGNTLYVSVKQSRKDAPEKDDYVLKIDLNKLK